VRVNEELGGGLRAGVVAEAGFNADTGAAAQGGRAFGRQVFVSLGHTAFGELRLGRQYVLEDAVMGLSNPYGNALVHNQSTSVTNMGRNLPMWLNAPRADNVIQYQSPVFGGFTAAAQNAPGENTADNFYGVRLAYAGKPVAAAVSYEWNKSRTTGDHTNKSLTFGANYDFGFLKLLGGYQRNTNLTTTSGNGAAVAVSNLIVTGATTFTADRINGWTLGADIPFGAATIVGINYSRVDYKGAGQQLNLGKFAVSGRYSLSKNTILYAGASQATGDLKDYISEKTVVQAGVRTAF
jgi:GBP family porin